MMSTGNDIIALAGTDNDRTSRHRFYSRILSPGELLLFPVNSLSSPGGRHPGTGLSFPVFVWLMWSIKESVYKYVSRADTGLRLAPLKIPVTSLRRSEDSSLTRSEDSSLTPREDYYEGMIFYRQCALYSRSFVVPGETIMTVVSAQQDFSDVRWGIGVIGDPGYSSANRGYPDYSTQSAKVRACALQSLSMVLPGAALRIIKTPDGPPEVWDGEHCLDIPLSLAHHGPYVAWSYRLPRERSRRLPRDWPYRLPANSSS
jgi:hypothetical protein